MLAHRPGALAPASEAAQQAAVAAAQAHVERIALRHREALGAPAGHLDLDLVDHVPAEDRRHRLNGLVALATVELRRPVDVLGADLQPAEDAVATDLAEIGPGEAEPGIALELADDRLERARGQLEVSVELGDHVPRLIDRSDRPLKCHILGCSREPVALLRPRRTLDSSHPIVPSGEAASNTVGAIRGAVVDEQE